MIGKSVLLNVKLFGGGYVGPLIVDPLVYLDHQNPITDHAVEDDTGYGSTPLTFGQKIASEQDLNAR